MTEEEIINALRRIADALENRNNLEEGEIKRRIDIAKKNEERDMETLRMQRAFSEQTEELTLDQRLIRQSIVGKTEGEQVEEFIENLDEEDEEDS